MYGSQSQFLAAGNFIQSNNRCFRLTFQENGNLVVKNLQNDEVMWSSDTKGSVINRKHGRFINDVTQIGHKYDPHPSETHLHH